MEVSITSTSTAMLSTSTKSKKSQNNALMGRIGTALQKMRTTIRSAAPEAEEALKCQPPIKGASMQPDTAKYNKSLAPVEQQICDLLAEEIDQNLPEAENKIWHAHPVWFLDGNPVVGYSKLKSCVRLLFWSGQSFEEEGLKDGGSFKAAEARYTAADQVDVQALGRWLAKAQEIQWDYKNIVRRKGKLERLK